MVLKSNFKRYEKKYLLSKEQYQNLKQLISPYMVVDEFGQTTICSIYYDTPDYMLIRKSIEKPVYKEKLRLRTYGIPSSFSTAFVELKKKYQGVVYKRRLAMPYEKALNQLNEKHIESDQDQIADEINYFINYYQGLRPSTALFYDRVAYIGRENHSYRMTFDHKISYRMTDLDTSLGSEGKALLENDYYLMEVKIRGAMPMWLSHALDSLGVYPSSYSKYGNAYLKMLKEKDI